MSGAFSRKIETCEEFLTTSSETSRKYKLGQFQRREEGVMATMLRVHSQDLHEHVALLMCLSFRVDMALCLRD